MKKERLSELHRNIGKIEKIPDITEYLNLLITCLFLDKFDNFRLGYSRTVWTLIGRFMEGYSTYVIGTGILTEPQTGPNPGDLLRFFFPNSKKPFQNLGIITGLSFFAYTVSESIMRLNSSGTIHE